MKPRDFAYQKATSLSEAIELLARPHGAAVLLAGGQSLLAGLNLRLSAPELLVDITGLDDLRGISVDKGAVRIGALTRHVDVLKSAVIKEHLPLMAEAIKWVAHAGIRNRGTIGGSVAYADPAAELPACLVALDASIVVQGAGGERRIKASDFFQGMFSTALQSSEIITEFAVPVQKTTDRWAFLELSRRHGDFAMAGIAIVAELDASNTASGVRPVYFGCTDRPTLAAEVAAAMAGKRLHGLDIDSILTTLECDLELDDTPGFRADTKLQLARTLTRRAIAHMASRSMTAT